MKDWNPDLYRQFEAERTRPAQEWLNRIPLSNVSSATDLGCDPGNSTELLHRAWPAARITGLDSSQGMLVRHSSGCRAVRLSWRISATGRPIRRRR